MIVVDTDVLSEVLRTRPDPHVLSWFADHHDLATTAITVGELLVGARGLPSGRRRDNLVEDIERSLDALNGSVLPYDDPAARRYAQLQVQRRAAGRALSVEVGMIASICASRSLPLASRNTKDFLDLGVELINPWSPDR